MRQVFIIRDADGDICDLSSTPQEGAVAASLDDKDVQAYLRDLDVDLVRVIEDVIDLLVARGIFRFTDLPQSAQEKLLFRKTLRSQWQSVPNPLDSDNSDIL